MKRSTVNRIEERSLEPISQLLARELMVPNIYWNAPWKADDKPVDVLVIDRAGSGPVHVVEMKESWRPRSDPGKSLIDYPADYRWIATFVDAPDKIAQLRTARTAEPNQGPGRLGIIAVYPKGDDGLQACIVRRAEKFAGSWRKQALEFAATHQPDITFE